MTLKELGIVVGVVLGAAYLTHCSDQRQQAQKEKVAAFKASDRAADSVAKAQAPILERLRQQTVRAAREADSLREVARQFQRQAAQAIPAKHPASPSVQEELGRLSPEAKAYLSAQDMRADQLESQNVALRGSVITWVRVDSLNQRIIAQKDSIIGADSVMIAALQRTRVAAREAVKATECRILGLVKCPSRTTVALVSLGLGVIGGYELARH